MKPTTLRGLLALSAPVLVLVILGIARLSASDRQAPRPAEAGARAPVASAARGDVRALWSAQPFVLERPFVHSWRREQPAVRSGWLLVLEVDPDLVRPRQNLEPVLYAGAETVERVNHGAVTGRVVAVLPGALVHGELEAELARTPFFFGEPELPERVDLARAAAELARALAAGARPFSAEEIAAARARGGDRLELGSREDLDALAGALVLEHSPDEHDLARGLMVPPLK